VDQNIIELKDLTKQYGTYTAVDHLDLTIRKSEIFGLLGPNGAGKSTTILMMLGLTEPTSGSVKVCGWDSTRNAIEVKRKVGYLPEDVGFYEDYNGLENLLYTARLNRIAGKEARQRAGQLLERVGLKDAINKQVGKYSRGMRQRLGLADVLIKNPEVIILDEPTLGLDPNGVQEFLSLIRQLSNEDGLTVLLSSHHLHQVQEICDRVGLFVKGKLLAEGNIQALSKNLFSSQPYSIEANVTFEQVSNSGSDHLRKSLGAIEGVLTVDANESVLNIGCSKNVVADIARTIVSSGADLNYLYKKEYGLDDIYRYYFNEKATHGSGN
jgi:ABC-2 type transport system ATP-binding protein